jgi:hypothetical protein
MDGNDGNNARDKTASDSVVTEDADQSMLRLRLMLKDCKARRTRQQKTVVEKCIIDNVDNAPQYSSFPGYGIRMGMICMPCNLSMAVGDEDDAEPLANCCE